jgi:hypothetical protein
MIPSYRVFGANRVSPRHPSLLIAYRVQKRQVNAVPLAPAAKERLQKDSKMRRGSLRLAARLAVSVLTGLALSSIAAPTGSPIAYTTLNFGTSGTFLTGIRGNNIVGNYVIPGTTETGWLLDKRGKAQTLFTIAHGTFGNQVESEAQSAKAQKILKSHANYKTTPFLDLF